MFVVGQSVELVVSVEPVDVAPATEEDEPPPPLEPDLVELPHPATNIDNTRAGMSKNFRMVSLRCEARVAASAAGRGAGYELTRLAARGFGD